MESNTGVSTGHQFPVTIYPNPAGDVVYIGTDNSQRAVNYEVHNAIGRIMIKGSMDAR